VLLYIQFWPGLIQNIVMDHEPVLQEQLAAISGLSLVLENAKKQLPDRCIHTSLMITKVQLTSI